VGRGLQEEFDVVSGVKLLLMALGSRVEDELVHQVVGALEKLARAIGLALPRL